MSEKKAAKTAKIANEAENEIKERLDLTDTKLMPIEKEKPHNFYIKKHRKLKKMLLENEFSKQEIKMRTKLLKITDVEANTKKITLHKIDKIGRWLIENNLGYLHCAVFDKSIDHRLVVNVVLRDDESGDKNKNKNLFWLKSLDEGDLLKKHYILGLLI